MLTIVIVRRLPESATRATADRLAAFLAAGEPDATARVVKGSPVILEGLVRGGELASEGDFLQHEDPSAVLYLDTAGRVATEHTDMRTIAYPLTWYRHGEG